MATFTKSAPERTYFARTVALARIMMPEVNDWGDHQSPDFERCHGHPYVK